MHIHTDDSASSRGLGITLKVAQFEVRLVGCYLIIDVDPSLEAILLELLLPKCQPQILALPRLNVLCPEALSPAQAHEMC